MQAFGHANKRTAAATTRGSYLPVGVHSRPGPPPDEVHRDGGPPSVAAGTEGCGFYIFRAGQGSKGWGLEIED
jgi:hypothetical protein